jgi:hypothetical protein
MRHLASRAFWQAYKMLPEQVRVRADKNYALLKDNPQHPSLQLKKSRTILVAVEADGDLVWFWIGSHADYDAMVR